MFISMQITTTKSLMMESQKGTKKGLSEMSKCIARKYEALPFGCDGLAMISMQLQLQRRAQVILDCQILG